MLWYSLYILQRNKHNALRCLGLKTIPNDRHHLKKIPPPPPPPPGGAGNNKILFLMCMHYINTECVCIVLSHTYLLYIYTAYVCVCVHMYVYVHVVSAKRFHLMLKITLFIKIFSLYCRWPCNISFNHVLYIKSMCMLN